jgi:hypothetical protein
MKKLAFALVTAACLVAPVQAMAQSKEPPEKESKLIAANEGWTSGQLLAIAGGAVVGVGAAHILVPSIMMNHAIGLIGGSLIGYYWYANEAPLKTKQSG